VRERVGGRGGMRWEEGQEKGQRHGKRGPS